MAAVRPHAAAKRFAADFEQHCECGEPALIGSVRINASLPGKQIPGDCDHDAVLSISDAICLFGILFLGELASPACGEFSALGGGHLTLLDWQADEGVNISDGIALLRFIFLEGPPHALAAPGAEATSCVPVVGCGHNFDCG